MNTPITQAAAMTREEAIRAAVRFSVLPPPAPPAPPSTLSRQMQLARDLLTHGPKTYRQISDALSISRWHASVILVRLTRAGRATIIRKGRPGNTRTPTLYALSITTPTK